MTNLRKQRANGTCLRIGLPLFQGIWINILPLVLLKSYQLERLQSAGIKILVLIFISFTVFFLAQKLTNWFAKRNDNFLKSSLYTSLIFSIPYYSYLAIIQIMIWLRGEEMIGIQDLFNNLSGLMLWIPYLFCIVAFILPNLALFIFLKYFDHQKKIDDKSLKINLETNFK